VQIEAGANGDVATTMKSPTVRIREVISVFVATFILLAVCPVTTSFDSQWVVPTAVSLVRHGDLDLDEYQPAINRNDSYGIQTVNHHRYDLFPWGTAVLVSPLVFLVDRGAQLFGTDLERYGRSNTNVEQRVMLRIEHSIGSLFVALTAAVVYRIGRERLRRKGALLLVAVFTLATPAFSVISRAAWSNGPAMFFMALTLLLLLRAGRRPSFAAYAGGTVGLAYLCRPTMSIAVVATGIYIVFRCRDQLLGFLACGGLVAILFFVVNLTVFHAWFPTYFRPGSRGRPEDVAQALAGNLISPSRGLLVFSPVLIFAVVGVISMVRQRKLTGVDVVAGATIVGHWVTISLFDRVWWGGHSYGPRLTADTLPCYCLLMTPVIAAVLAKTAHRYTTIVLRASFAVLLGFSVLVHLRGAVDSRPLAWNIDPDVYIENRVWDWTRPQFLYHLW
jgi:hypothetical protein